MYFFDKTFNNLNKWELTVKFFENFELEHEKYFKIPLIVLSLLTLLSNPKLGLSLISAGIFLTSLNFLADSTLSLLF